jgi:hypothetical protein
MNTANIAPSAYTPVDAMNRHDYGIQKNRKQASTGGGRAWSEDEVRLVHPLKNQELSNLKLQEVYLLQTRLQKMPYKHIAAHLKKTELACRLHYHQLSHGSNRRKRTSSVTSSSAGSVGHSPEMTHSMPSPISEHDIVQSVTTPSYTYSPQSPVHVQLPSASTLLNHSMAASPPRTISHPIAILPKPSPPRRSLSDSSANAPLRLDCNVEASQINIDKERLRHIYEAHRASFWGVIAAEYGSGVSPALLEESWKRGIATNGPPTPCGSPDTLRNEGYKGYTLQPLHQLPTPIQETKTSATSISALLGIVSSSFKLILYQY